MSACMFLLVSCLGGMRGFEVVWLIVALLLCQIKADSESAENHPKAPSNKMEEGVLQGLP